MGAHESAHERRTKNVEDRLPGGPFKMASIEKIEFRIELKVLRVFVADVVDVACVVQSDVFFRCSCCCCCCCFDDANRSSTFLHSVPPSQWASTFVVTGCKTKSKQHRMKEESCREKRFQPIIESSDTRKLFFSFTF